METDLILGIFDIVEVYDERTGQPMYRVSIRCASKPNLKLGECKIIQGDVQVHPEK